MNENLEEISVQEPENQISENSKVETENLGQVSQQEIPNNLILGKFKTNEDLVKAYQELEKLQGQQSKELGELRQNSSMFDKLQKLWEKESSIKNEENNLKAIAQKYESYFQNDAFKDIFKAAYLSLGQKLDTDKFVNLLENYVSSRVYALEQEKSAKSENERAISSLNFSKNNSSDNLQKPMKRLDEMTPQEVDELLEQFI